MQKKINAKTIGAVYLPYKINVQVKGSKLENKKTIKITRIDEAKTYEKVIVF